MGEFLVWALMLDRGGISWFTYLAIIRAPNFCNDSSKGALAVAGGAGVTGRRVLPSFLSLILSLGRRRPLRFFCLCNSAPPIMSFGVPPFSLLPPVSWRPRPLVLIRPRCKLSFPGSEGEVGETSDSGWKIRPSLAGLGRVMPPS